MLGHFRDPARVVMQRNSGWNWSSFSINNSTPGAAPWEQEDSVMGLYCTVLLPHTKDFNSPRASQNSSLSVPKQI